MNIRYKQGSEWIYTIFSEKFKFWEGVGPCDGRFVVKVPSMAGQYWGRR